jgi:magnesium chelatase family protein
VQRYRDRISGPLLDRFDLLVEVTPQAGDALFDGTAGSAEEGTTAIRARVCAARERQLRRQGIPNSELRDEAIGHRVPLADADRLLLQQAVRRFGLSARACHRVLRVARSIADLDDRDTVQTPDLAEALGYRLGDRAAHPA